MKKIFLFGCAVLLLTGCSGVVDEIPPANQPETRFDPGPPLVYHDCFSNVGIWGLCKICGEEVPGRGLEWEFNEADGRGGYMDISPFHIGADITHTTGPDGKKYVDITLPPEDVEITLYLMTDLPWRAFELIGPGDGRVRIGMMAVDGTVDYDEVKGTGNAALVIAYDRSVPSTQTEREFMIRQGPFYDKDGWEYDSTNAQQIIIRTTE